LPRPILAGPVETTALGNVLVQAMVTGALRGLSEARAIAHASTDIRSCELGTTTRAGNPVQSISDPVLNISLLDIGTTSSIALHRSEMWERFDVSKEGVDRVEIIGPDDFLHQPEIVR